MRKAISCGLIDAILEKIDKSDSAIVSIGSSPRLKRGDERDEGCSEVGVLGRTVEVGKSKHVGQRKQQIGSERTNLVVNGVTAEELMGE
jgi:hypothetical protein